MTYDYADLSELALARAVTIHKSQGSEYPVVILPLFMQHYVLLSRNLLYTGLTRAKQLAILVGPTKAIGFAVTRILDWQRYTALAERLKITWGQCLLNALRIEVPCLLGLLPIHQCFSSVLPFIDTASCLCVV